MLHHSSSGGGGRAAWASNDDYLAFSLVVIVLGLAFGAYELWTNYHAEISWGVFNYAHWQMFYIGKFTHEYAAQDAALLEGHPDQATIWQLWSLLNNVGRFFRIPAVVVMLLLAILCYFRAAPSRYCRQFDLAGLRKEQARFFRSSSAMMGRHLGLVGIGKGDPRPADPAVRVEEWVERYAKRHDGSLNETAATRTLVRQLGPKWTGFEHAAPHVRFLFAAFALHLTGRRDEGFVLLGEPTLPAHAAARRRGHIPTSPVRLARPDQTRPITNLTGHLFVSRTGHVGCRATASTPSTPRDSSILRIRWMGVRVKSRKLRATTDASCSRLQPTLGPDEGLIAVPARPA